MGRRGWRVVVGEGCGGEPLLPLLFTTVPFENDLLELVTDIAPGHFAVNIPVPQMFLTSSSSPEQPTYTTDLKTHAEPPPLRKNQYRRHWKKGAFYRTPSPLPLPPQPSETRRRNHDEPSRSVAVKEVRIKRRDFQPRWKRGGGGGWRGGEVVLAGTWHGTQPGRLMVLTASDLWLGIRGCNWVEPIYGPF